MPSNLSKKDVNALREDLLRLSNCLYDLRAEMFAQVARRAEKALAELLELVEKPKSPTAGIVKEKHETP